MTLAIILFIVLIAAFGGGILYTAGESDRQMDRFWLERIEKQGHE